jgi:CDP-diacylglycerol--glycerol-3-phosphate 3-phosphatidyltransferase
MFGSAIEPYLSWAMRKIAAFLALLRLTPNALTIIGVFLNAIVAVVLIQGRFFLGGCLYSVVSLSDLLDGLLARQRNMSTRFGAFLDSVMDRFGDSVIFTGLLLHYSIVGNLPCVLLCAACLFLALITSYTRARAESLIPKCKVGFMERPERVFLLAIGLVFNRVPICLLLMVISSIIIIVDRIYLTRRELEKMEAAKP